MMVVAIGLMVVLYPISPILAPLPVLIRYGSIPGVVLIRHGSIPGAVLESVKLSIVERGGEVKGDDGDGIGEGVWYGSCDRYGSIPVAALIRYGSNPGAVAYSVKWGIVDGAGDGGGGSGRGMMR